MRTTVNLPDDLIALAKRTAAENKQTLGAFLESAVRERLLRAQPGPEAFELRLVTFGVAGLSDGVTYDQLKHLVDDEEVQKSPRFTSSRAADSK